MSVKTSRTRSGLIGIQECAKMSTKNIMLNGKKVLSKDCETPLTQCLVLQNIMANKFYYEIDGDTVWVKVYYENDRAKDFCTICNNCSKQRE